jgi:hypothetical protein
MAPGKEYIWHSSRVPTEKHWSRSNDLLRSQLQMQWLISVILVKIDTRDLAKETWVLKAEDASVKPKNLKTRQLLLSFYWIKTRLKQKRNLLYPIEAMNCSGKDLLSVKEPETSKAIN